jgi:hypothetical protein
MMVDKKLKTMVRSETKQKIGSYTITPISNSSHSKTENRIGFFDNFNSCVLFKGIIDKLLFKSNAGSLLVGTSSWREQFKEAVTVSAGKFTICPYCLCYVSLSTLFSNMCVHVARRR